VITACIRLAGISSERENVRGGAIALGHAPISSVRFSERWRGASTTSTRSVG